MSMVIGWANKPTSEDDDEWMAAADIAMEAREATEDAE